VVFAGVLVLFEAGEDKQHAGGSLAGIAPAVKQAGNKQQAIARFEHEALTLDLILQVPFEQEDKLVPEWIRPCGPLVAPGSRLSMKGSTRPRKDSPPSPSQRPRGNSTRGC